MSLARARALGQTYRLALRAAEPAGVTRLGDVTGLAGLGVPVYQAVRPEARSFAVAMGKGASPLAARVSALLEAIEIACAERIAAAGEKSPLASLAACEAAVWSSYDADCLGINLDPDVARHWLTGSRLDDGTPAKIPWDLVSLDLSVPSLDYRASSDGLASGNTRTEALVGALGELVEHHLAARFDGLGPLERRSCQLACDSISDPAILHVLRQIERSGFTPRLWSMGQDHGIAAIACALFPPEPALDHMTPVFGTACSPDKATALLGAVREAVQSRAGLVAGARDDLTSADYSDGRARTRALALGTLAFDDGPLSWADVPCPAPRSFADALDVLQAWVASESNRPVVVYDHAPPIDGIHVVHAFAPGLRNLSRGRARNSAGRPDGSSVSIRLGREAPEAGRTVLFAGPSIAGLAVPPSIEVRGPAACGDLAALLRAPPAAVGLIDGWFGIAPSVWHKEILLLMSQGVQVFGAASIGALRAAELHEQGMVGVGDVYEAYRNGTIVRDDAVMLLHAPDTLGFAPLTLPLVDAEYALCRVDCEPAERRTMQRIVRTMPYALRTWRRCLDAFRARTGRPFPISEEALRAAPSLKRRDAGLLLERLETMMARSSDPIIRPLPPLSGYHLTMLASVHEGPGAGPQ